MVKKGISVGERYGRLVVREDLGTAVRGTWKDRTIYARKVACVCDCGGSIEVWAAHLRSGSTQSCGCLYKSKQRHRSLPKGEAAFRTVLRSYKANAKNRGIAFGLTKQQFRALILQPCSYCGQEASTVARTRAGYGDFTYNGLDRVNSSLGYVEGNVVPCCSVCNRAKMDMDLTDFLAWVRRIHEHSIENPLDLNVVRIIF